MANLNRRQLVGGSAALLGTLALPSRGASRWRGPNLKKAVKIGMVKVDGSLKDKFQLLVDLGFDGVELDSPNDLDPDEVLAAKEATGIQIPGVVDAVHWRDTLGDPDPEVRARGLRGLETALRDAKTYGGTTALLVPAVVNEKISYDEAYRRSQEEIRKALPLAQELEIAIAIENVWNHFLLSPMEAARYVDQFESPWVGWYFDVGNIVELRLARAVDPHPRPPRDEAGHQGVQPREAQRRGALEGIPGRDRGGRLQLAGGDEGAGRHRLRGLGLGRGGRRGARAPGGDPGAHGSGLLRVASAALFTRP